MTGRIFVAMPQERMAAEIREAVSQVILAAPGIHLPVAQAIKEAVGRLGQEAVTVILDCHDEVCRMGYGAIAAIKLLQDEGLIIRNSPGLRVGLLLCDDQAWAFSPAVLCVEDETREDQRPNAVSLSTAQAKALVEAINPTQPTLFGPSPPEIGASQLDEESLERTEKSLKERPPQKFDIARIVRYYQSYFHYVEAHLQGLAINRRQVQLPKSLINITADKDLEARLRTTFNLIEKNSDLSDQTIKKKLDQLLKDMAPSLGQPWGRVILRENRAEFDKKIAELHQEIATHQGKVSQAIKQHLDDSIGRIAKVFAKSIKKNPPEKLRYRVSGEITEALAEGWLKNQLAEAFPKPEEIVNQMKLVVHFRDVTFETLNAPDFLKALKKEFPMIDWPYVEHEAAQAKKEQ